jgi:hypothetical protein
MTSGGWWWWSVDAGSASSSVIWAYILLVETSSRLNTHLEISNVLVTLIFFSDSLLEKLDPTDTKQWCRLQTLLPARHISLRTFMQEFPDINDKERLLGLWSGKVLPYLRGHNESSKKMVGSFLAKESSNDLKKIINEVLATVCLQYEYSTPRTKSRCITNTSHLRLLRCTARAYD